MCLQVNDDLTEYEQAQERAASYRREVRRLESEIENLRTNLATGVMSAEQLRWLDTEIRKRMERIKELADLRKQPIGVAIGKPMPGKDDIELVRELLANLRKTWQHKRNGLKNALLQLVLDHVTIWADPETIRATLFWRNGWEQKILINRPGNGPLRYWSDAELKILQKHYETTTKDELLAMLPGRSWKAIRGAAIRQGLSRGKGGSRGGQRPYTLEEDDLIRRYYAGDITRQQVLRIGRSTDSIAQRARRLGLTWIPRQPNWEPLEDDSPFLESGSAP